ncbi:AAA family ATPase [Coleofasciculus chthonoplastes]|uniref:AAA family ATPase n=1 Tax=Coleofasciculus chthonoplastes TaxID=64178 RepID=UPI0032FAAFB4
MHLQRIRVPDFRVLKDVDITFEKDFVPRIFPLGSLNGGGKSTLLQLIFTLLHCSTDPERKPFLQNLLYGFEVRDDSPKRTLAKIDIWNNDRTVSFNFFCCKYSYIQEKLQLSDDYPKYYHSLTPQGFQDLINNYLVWINSCKFDFLGALFKRYENMKNIYFEKEFELNDWDGEILARETEDFFIKIEKYLESEKLIFVSEYRVNKEGENDKNFLLCHIDGLNTEKITEVELFFKDISRKIFLAAPSTQVFLFMDQESRNLLFKSQSGTDKDYSSQLKDARSKLINLFTYDFLAVDLLIQAFKDARDRDFREAIETGEYGNNYQRLKNELNQMLFNKKINIDKDFNGVNFTLDRNGETIELSPEDLSHGELKRLSIYMWLKHHNIEDAIVLMDEIEIAFHPDWQYQIIQDLQEWAPNNQYILATHSYELCQALTPAHVKELEPKLIQQDPEN